MEQQKFIDFKESFIELAKTEYNACDSFVKCIEDAKTILDLKQALHDHAENIFERLGGEFDTYNLELEIDYLQSQVENLEVELSEYDDVKETLHDEMKFKTFIELHAKYTPWEFEQLLLNGKL